MSEQVRILIADDHAVLRAGLILLLNKQKDFLVIGEASTGIAAIALIEELLPDLLLLDHSMPGLSGLDSIKTLKKVSPKTKILMLTMHDDPEYLKKALQNGASGYILKKAADSELISAIRSVMKGEIYVHPSMTRGILGDFVSDKAEEDQNDAWQELSKREKQVLKLVAWGNTSNEIAEELSLSSKTVDTYRARGMEKLNIKTRASLVRLVIKRGMFHPNKQ